jgi:hypothetical protein
MVWYAVDDHLSESGQTVVGGGLPPHSSRRDDILVDEEIEELLADLLRRELIAEYHMKVDSTQRPSGSSELVESKFYYWQKQFDVLQSS